MSPSKLPLFTVLGAAALCVAIVGILLARSTLVGVEDIGCTAQDERLVPAIQSLPILEQHPLGATKIQSSGGCDPEGRYAYATRRYHYTGTPETAVAFYLQVGNKDGWSVAARKPSPALTPGRLATQTARVCLKKSVDDSSVFLNLVFERDLNQGSSDEYRLEVRTSLNPRSLCA